MAKGYWIARVESSTWTATGIYAPNAAVFRKFGGRFLVRGGAFETVEGSSRLAQCGDRIPRLRHRARLLQIAGVSARDGDPRAAFRGRSHYHRRL